MSKKDKHKELMELYNLMIEAMVAATEANSRMIEAAGKMILELKEGEDE